MKKYSNEAPASDSHATREVKIDTEYKSSDNPDVSVPPEQRTKAYKYGKNFIPISSSMEDSLKFKPEKGVKLKGFVKRSDIPRYVDNLTFPHYLCERWFPILVRLLIKE